MIYADDWLSVYAGDCREVLATLPAESVHCVVTSPPYWGLRDYGTASWDGGDPDCDHAFKPDAGKTTIRTTQTYQQGHPHRDCKCGATRIDNQLGLEPTPEQYVENMVAVFREVRRVLRNDGTLWLNLGDSYNSGTQFNAHSSGLGGGARYSEGARGDWPGHRPLATGLKPKDLVGIPWRVAFALQADGWYLRSDIIWSKPNPMPESVTDRPTKSHEYVFLLSKSPRYYFDADAVREAPSPNSTPQTRRDLLPSARAGIVVRDGRQNGPGNRLGNGSAVNENGRNIRSVWTIATQPYPGAHFAVFPPKLVEPCIKAGTSEKGVCPECGAPWRRVVERAPDNTGYSNGPGGKKARDPRGNGASPMSTLATVARYESSTLGWQPSCAHDAAPIPATCLDPFAGSGTVGMVAQNLSRRAILIDLNPSYIEQQLRRNRDVPLGLSA